MWRRYSLEQNPPPRWTTCPGPPLPLNPGSATENAIAADAAWTHQFYEKTLRFTLAEIAHRSYLEVVTRRERMGSPHELSIRIARGVYYRPSAFRSRHVERDETIHVDTGLLGFTTKHIYFSGPKKKFQV